MRRAPFVLLVLATIVIPKNLNAQQAPRLSIDDNGGTGQYTHSYQLQATERLESPAWTNAGPATFGPGGTMALTNLGLNASQLFYRVVVTTGFECTNSGATACASAISLGAYPADALMRQIGCVPAQCQQVAQRSGCGSAWFSVLYWRTQIVRRHCG